VADLRHRVIRCVPSVIVARGFNVRETSQCTSASPEDFEVGCDGLGAFKTSLTNSVTGMTGSRPTSKDIGAGLLSRVLRLGPWRLFARPGCLVVDGDTRRTQPGQQYRSYRGKIESNILGIWWMCLAVLQSERQVQLLAKALND
jgi:hypothetical protein